MNITGFGVRPDAADIVRQPAHRGGCRRADPAAPWLPAPAPAPGGRGGDRCWSRARPISPRLGAHRPTGPDTGHPWLAFLLFLAGLEIDLRTLRGRALRLAVRGYRLTLVLGAAVGAGLGAVGWTRSPLLVAIALSATSLGLVVPVLKDAGQADGLVGQTIIASATVADFAAIVLLTLFFSTSGRALAQRLCCSRSSRDWL